MFMSTIIRQRRRGRKAVCAFALLLLWGALFGPAPTCAQETPAALEGFGAYAEAVMQDWKVPGMAIAVVKDSQVVYSKGFGYRDVEEEQPVSPRTLFAIGSASKAFTATVLATLADDGAIEWDEPVVNYLPGFRLADDCATANATPVDLLSHQIGLPRHDFLWYGSDLTRKQMFKRLRYLEPSETFRDRFQYQNLMYMSAGYLTGQITGSSWEALVRERLLEPLGMERSNLSVDRMQEMSNHALPYGGGRDSLEQIDFRNIDAIGPAGSINSSAREMIEWVKLHLGNGTYQGERVVSKANLRLMHSPQKIVEEWPLEFVGKKAPYLMYGLGWFLQPYRGHRLIHHGGNIDGFSALVGFLHDDAIGFVILTNKNGTPLPNVLMYDLIDRLLGYDEGPDWNARVDSIYAQREAQEEEEGAGDDQSVEEGTEPSHELSAYAGRYEHPAYGTLRVEQNGEGLRMKYHTFKVSLKHYHYDVFSLQSDEFEGMKIKFGTNVDGGIDQAALPLEPAVDDIVFERIASEKLTEVDYLRQFVGEYEVKASGRTVTVQLQGDALALSVPEQPTCELVPDEKDQFKLKGMSSYSLEFKRQDGRVTQVVLNQPNGQFTATRK